MKTPVIHAVNATATYIKTNKDTVCGLSIIKMPGDIYVGQPVTCETCKAILWAREAKI